MAQLRQHKKELDQKKVDVRVITFDDDLLAQAYFRKMNLDWPLLLDPDQKLYRDYGMLRGSWWAIYNPVSIFRYLKLIFAGHTPGRPGRDWHQLGGDVVIDPEGTVRLHHISENPHDRPSIESLMETVGL